LPETIAHIEGLIGQGRYIEARIKSEEALQSSTELRYKQLHALAVSKLGMPETALALMEPVYQQFPDDSESAGILGSIYKALFKKNQNNSFAIKSRDTYFQNFTVTKNYYTGINAAAMAAMAGQGGRSREIATEVIALIGTDTAGDFWKLATLGEAYILTKNRARSIEYFVEARKLAGNDWGKITSVHNQLWLLNHFIPVSGEIMKMFSPPTVVAFIGHMIDHPNRSTPRFPASIEPQVKSAIANSIRTLNAHIGYCSLACGGDILFAEAMAEQGGEVNIFLPFAEADFIEESVRFAGEEWMARYTNLVKKFPITYVTREAYAGLDDLFSFQNKVICGSSVLRSSSHHSEPSLLTVLSGVDLKRKQGGTRDTINVWPFPKNYININPDTFITTQASVTTEMPASVKTERIERPVLSIVYVDIHNVQAMGREKLLKEIDSKIFKEEISFASYQAEQSYLLAAFEMNSSAMEFVSLVMETLKSNRQDSFVKISLDVGPVFLDPQSNKLNKKLSGKAIDFVNAMNTLGPSGSVFASDFFAALLALELKKYTLDYSGMLPVEGGANRNVYTVNFISR
jgi:hypothetical protein